MRLIFIIFSVAIVAGCGIMKKSNAFSAGGGSSFVCTTAGRLSYSMKSYQETSYAATAGTCRNCHGNPPVGNGHPFQDLDIAKSYDEVFIGDTNRIADWVAKIRVGHQGIPAGFADTIQASLNTYNSRMASYDTACRAASNGGGGGNGGGGSSGSVTPEANRQYSAPQALTGLSANYVVKSFSMAGSTGSPFNAVTITAEIKYFQPNAAGTSQYVMVKNISVASPSAAIRVRNVRFRVGSTWRWYENPNFGVVDVNVPAGSTPLLLSATTEIVDLGSSSTPLEISAQMDSQGAASGATELQQFANDVRPLLVTKCASCHATQSLWLFSAATSEADMRASTILRSDRTTPNNSQIIRRAFLPDANGGIVHTGAKPLLQAEADRIASWMRRIP